MEFRGKAHTLTFLRERLTLSCVLPLQIVNGNGFFSDRNKTILSLQSAFPGQSVAVRSSSCQEDTGHMSLAGKFLSVLNVDSSDSTALRDAVEKVFASYGTCVLGEEVLVQPMLCNVKLAGVALTCDINTSAPYYMVNYSQDGSTSAVTGGRGDNLKTYIAYKNTPPHHMSEPAMTSLINALRELENLCGSNCLDVEFAVNESDEIYIFQVRPIVNWHGRNDALINMDIPLNRLYNKIEKLLRPHPFLFGNTTCFGVMPDWNPAEILGARPKKLAVSIYKELVTDNIWARQRNNYGYRDLTSHPLMVLFCGIPYIDVRVTFNSFIPQKLNSHTANMLIDYYIQKLRDYPAYHDKVEFEVVWSCYYFGIKERLRTLLQYGFTDVEINEIEHSLLDLTNTVIHPDHGMYKKDINEVGRLIENHEKIVNSDISVIDKIYWLIEECKNYGTLPFAGVARAGFIAVQFLRSFVSCGILTDVESSDFMASLCTVSRQISIDYFALTQGSMSRDAFLQKYGHIRPNTYDLMSARYDEAFDLYFGKISSNQAHTASSEAISFQFSEKQMGSIQKELENAGLNLSAEQLIAFIREAIEGREQVKLIFTRSVSEILRLIRQLGEQMKIPTEDMAHLDISILKQLYVDLYYDNLEIILKNNIEMNKAQFSCASMLKLPELIRFPDDVYSFYAMENEPNFITTKVVSGETASENILVEQLENKIVFIPAADPGYDFLFTKHIGGLITEFGGANSHMAIRCAEMGMPAVIGAGAKYYQWKQHRQLVIDCKNRIVTGMDGAI